MPHNALNVIHWTRRGKENKNRISNLLNLPTDVFVISNADYHIYTIITKLHKTSRSIKLIENTLVAEETTACTLLRAARCARALETYQNPYIQSQSNWTLYNVHIVFYKVIVSRSHFNRIRQQLEIFQQKSIECDLYVFFFVLMMKIHISPPVVLWLVRCDITFWASNTRMGDVRAKMIIFLAFRILRWLKRNIRFCSCLLMYLSCALCLFPSSAFRFLFFTKRERLYLNEPPFSFSCSCSCPCSCSMLMLMFIHRLCDMFALCVNHHRPYWQQLLRASDMMNSFSFSFRQAIMVYYVPFNGFCRCYTCQHNRRRLLYWRSPFLFALSFAFISAFSFDVSRCLV